MRPLHLLDTSLPLVAGYTSRTRGVLEAQRAAGLQPRALTGRRQGPSARASAGLAPSVGPAGALGMDASEGAGEVELLHGVLHYRTAAGGPPLALPLLSEWDEIRALARRAVEVGREQQVDLVHAHSPSLCGLAGLQAARALRVPFVYEVRALWEDAAAQAGKLAEGSWKYKLSRALETRVARRADALVVLCEGLREEFLRRGISADRIQVVGNGVDPARFSGRGPGTGTQALARSLGLAGRRVVAYVGSLFRFEGVASLLRVLARLTREDPGLSGLVVGAGECEGELRELHRELGLGESVRLLGQVPPEEVASVYGLVDVLVYPREPHRITELTTPLKPLEALALGKAVVASDVGGHRELLRHADTALLYPAGSEEGLLQQLRRATRDPELRLQLGQRGRREVLGTRTWAQTCAAYPEVYARVLQRRGERAGGGTSPTFPAP